MLVILHISWRQRKVNVWGEKAAIKHAPCPEAGKQVHTRASPYDAGSAALGRILNVFLWDTAELQVSAYELRLPTFRTAAGLAPMPSQPFLMPDGAPGAPPVSLDAWRVSAASLTWKQAFTFLGACQERRLADGVFAGEDLLAFAHLFRFAGSLVARGKFLPALARRDDGCIEARWQASLDTTDRQRLAALAARLPPLLTLGADPLLCAAEMLEELTDHLVRFSVVTTLSRSHAEHGKFYSAHDAWFAALRGDNPVIRWEASEELDALHDTIALWRRPVESRAARDSTLLFQLEEPPVPDQPWFLHVRLGGVHQTGVTEWLAGADEALLIALGQAAMLFAPLAKAERLPRGFGCALASDEAHAFLNTAAPLLEAAGYGIGLPPWWSRHAHHAVTLEVDAMPHADTAASPQALKQKVALNWTVTLDGQPVSREELEALLASESPLVFFRGRWIQVNVRQLQEALRVSQRKQADMQSALEVVRLALGTSGRNGLEVSDVRGGGWLDPFLKRLRGEQAFDLLPPPVAFCGELRPYQIRGFSWLAFLRAWGFGACLADDMGLGKTIQTLAFLLHEKARGERRPVLLVAPMSVLGNWLRECRRFAPDLRMLLHHGAQRWHGDSFARETKGADVVLTSYHLLYRDYADLRKVGWAGIVLDEAQNIKNPDTRQAQAARALQADYRIALTGTPVENHVGDLWSLMDFLNPGLLGKRAVFREVFFRPIQSGTDPGARTRLRRITAPFLLRRFKTDKQIISDLPEKREGTVTCFLTREQAHLYEEVLEQFRRDAADAEGIARRGLILGVLTRLKQVCNHPAHYLSQPQAMERPSGKLQRLEEMLEEIFERGESALVFTQYAEMGALLKQRLCETFNRDMPFLHGGVPRKARDRMVQAFQESAEPLAFVLSLKAGGTGLNLTRASHVFHYDRWWNPAVEDQATDRAFRIGQTRNVMVHKFLCGGTLEERIDDMIAHKSALAAEIVASGEAFLTEFSDAELDEILRLSETVIADEVGE